MYIVIIVVLILVTVGLLYHMMQMKKRLQGVNQILDEIAEGNLDRKLIARDASEFSSLCCKINEIVSKYKSEIEDLQQSEKTYRQLVTSLSHDVRTPLASLLGYLNAIRDEVVEGEEKDEFIKLSEEKAVILKYYIDTLFEWLKIESGEKIFYFEKTDICELMREIVVQWIPQMEQNNVGYEIDIPEQEIELLLDESSVRRIMNNLMQNVFTHSKTKEVKIGILDTEENICIYVQDYGVGIAEKDLPHIFERLYKCDSARSERGNGLGLAIVSELVKANQGKINVTSRLGEGCCFTIEFPKSNS